MKTEDKFILPPVSELKKRDLNPNRYGSTYYDVFDNAYDLGFIEGKSYVANNIIKYLKNKGWNNDDIKQLILNVCDYEMT